MPSAVADVLDMERVLSLAPLSFDLTSAFVAGWQAVCRRILYRWCTRVGSDLSDPNYGVTIPITSHIRSTVAGGTALQLSRPYAEFILPSMEAGAVYAPRRIEGAGADFVEVWD